MAVIKKGDTGEKVKQIQEALQILIDGIFGNMTELSVRTFQDQNGLVVDGVAKELKFGLKTTLDLLDAEKGFNGAELRLVQARHDITLKKFKLAAATGSLTADKLGIGHVLDKLTDSLRPANPLKKPFNFW